MLWGAQGLGSLIRISPWLGIPSTFLLGSLGIWAGLKGTGVPLGSQGAQGWAPLRGPIEIIPS